LYPKLAKEAAVPTAPRMSLARVQFITDIISLLGFFRKRFGSLSRWADVVECR
jgi:hypothetical protein